MQQGQFSSIAAIRQQALDAIPEQKREDLLSIWSVISVFMRRRGMLGRALGWGSLHASGAIANALLFRLAFSAVVPGGVWWLLLIPPHVAVQQLLVRRRFQEAVNQFADTGRADLYGEITRTLTRSRRPYSEAESERLRTSTERHVTSIWDVWRNHLPWLALDAMAFMGALAGVFVVVGSIGTAAIAANVLCAAGAWIAVTTSRAARSTLEKQRRLETSSETRQRRLLQILDVSTWGVFDRTQSREFAERAIDEAVRKEKDGSIDVDRDRVVAGGHATVATATLDVAAVTWAALSNNFALLPLVYLVQMVGQIAGRMPDHVLAVVSRVKATSEIGKTLRTPPAVREHPDARPLPRLTSAITLEHVSARYDNGAIALCDVTLEIAAGEVVALIGDVGSGKTTFLNVLRGHHEPVAGAVKFDGRDLRQARHVDIDNQIALVPQRPIIINMYDGTVEENLRVGNPKMTQEQLLAACVATGFDRWLRKEGCSLATPVASSELSGGERQAFETARMLLKPAAVLLIDEATAALDHEGTARFVKIVRDARAKGQTVVLVTHSGAVALEADRVVALSGGRIVECGAPSELLQDQSSRLAVMFPARSVRTQAPGASSLDCGPSPDGETEKPPSSLGWTTGNV